MSTVPKAVGPDEPQGGRSTGSLAEVDHALALMRQALAAHPLPSTFSDQAWTELLKRESEFVGELGLESIRLARQKRCDVVSTSDVGEADSSIRQAGLASLWTSLQTVGGVLAGAGVTGLIAVVGEKHPNSLLLAFSIIGLAVGSAIIAFTLGRIWPRWKR